MTRANNNIKATERPAKAVERRVVKDLDRAERAAAKDSRRAVRVPLKEVRAAAARTAPVSPYDDVEQLQRNAAAEYLLSLADPSGQPARRGPDMIRMPTAVFKTKLVQTVKVVPIPGTGGGQPNYGLAVVINPKLTKKITSSSTMVGGLWTAQATVDDPVYGASITDTTFPGVRTTAMGVRVTCSASVLNAAGSMRVLCAYGLPLTVSGQAWNILAKTNAAVIDPRSPNLGAEEFCWNWANVGDMTYWQPSSPSGVGPLIWIELGSNSADMEIVVEVTTHYQGYPSPAQMMIMETQPSAYFGPDRLEEARLAAASIADTGISALRDAESKERQEEAAGLDDGWSATLFRGASRLVRAVNPGIARGIDALTSALHPDSYDADDDDDGGDDEAAVRDFIQLRARKIAARTS